MSDSVIVVNADGPETRVALIESGILSEFYVERERERGCVVVLHDEGRPSTSSWGTLVVRRGPAKSIAIEAPRPHREHETGRLAAELWQDVMEHEDEVQDPPGIAAMLEDRLARYRAGEITGRSWAEVRAAIQRRD